MKWEDLDYWKSGEWDVVQERLEDLTKQGVIWNPGRRNLLNALHECPYDTTRVCILGQDPYPNPAHACGLAFSIPNDVEEKNYPPTLRNILKEYEDDLHYGKPSSGWLGRWASSGVLLWNAYPSCEAFRSLSHHWEEYEPLTKEICERLDDRGIVFVLLGTFAQDYAKYLTRSSVIAFTHPSPLAARHQGGKHPAFIGSRLFSTVNGKLKELGMDLINWRL